ncbi:MAG: hypothetical protein ACE5IK_06525 [Acidobacteriota bacterium]
MTVPVVLPAASLAVPSVGPHDVASPSSTETTDETTALDERVRELTRQVAALQAEMERLKGGEAAPSERLDELERQIEILSEAIEDLTLGEAAPPAAESIRGFGPAASKVYSASGGVSLGGYGEMLYQNFDTERDDGAASGKTDQLDFLRQIIYFGYKYNDRILFNSEIEYEHANTEENGAVEVEFGYLDFRFNDHIGARAGLLLMPMGFINELHEPPIFLGARRPDVARFLIPTTWSETGAGVFGEVGPVSYRAYVISGLDAAGLDQSGFSARGIRGGRQKGSEALAEDLAFVARADWRVRSGLTVGASFYTGDAGQGAVAPTSLQRIDASTDILEAHVEWRWRGLQTRGLWVTIDVDDAALINDFQDPTRMLTDPSASVGEQMTGHYLEAGYDILAPRSTEQALIPFVRYEAFDTQDEVPAGFTRDPANDVEIWTYGLSYKPIPNVVLKVDYQDYDNEAGTGTDQFNVAVGWLF